MSSCEKSAGQPANAMAPISRACLAMSVRRRLSDLKVIALLDHRVLHDADVVVRKIGRPTSQRHGADLGEHHLGRGGVGPVGGTFENHAVSKTCLAIC